MKKNMKVGGSKATVLTIVKYIATILLFVFYMVPFILVVINSVKANRDIIRNPFSLFETSAPPTFSNYTGAFERMDFLRAFGNSFFITGLSTVLVIVLSAMVAYYIVRNKTKASNIVYFGMIASMIIPFQAIMIPLVSIYGATLGLLNHRLTLVFLHVGFGMSMSYLFDMPLSPFAVLGSVGMLSGGTNLPLVCFALGMELYGYKEPTMLFLMVTVSFLASGRSGIYAHQKLPYR